MAGRSSNCSGAPRDAARGRPAGRPARGFVRRARLGRSISSEPHRGPSVTLADGRAISSTSRMARFFIAIGLLTLSEQQIEYGRTASSVSRALPSSRPTVRSGRQRRGEAPSRDPRAAEIVGLGPGHRRGTWCGEPFTTSDNSSWAVQIAGDSARLTSRRMVERDRQCAALRLPAVSGSLRLHRLGAAALAGSLLPQAPAWWPPTPTARAASPSRRASDADPTFVSGSARLRDHRRPARARPTPSVTFGYIVTAWLAIVSAFVAFPLLALLEAPGRAQGPVGRGPRRRR